MADPETRTPRLNPKEDIEAIKDNLKKAQHNAAGAVEELGYQLRIVEAVEPYWKSVNPNTIHGAVASGAAVMSQWRSQSDVLIEQTKQLKYAVASMSGTAMVSATTTVTLNQMHPATQDINHNLLQPLISQRTEQDLVVESLRRIDPTLAAAYATVWQFMHFPALDPVRGPLFLMRQVFDHFLENLAPDDKVAGQPDFKPDEKLKERNGKGITRRHRIGYLATYRIQDASDRAVVLTSTNSFLDIYKELNQAHKRERLDENAGRAAVYAGNALLVSWLRSLRFI